LISKPFLGSVGTRRTAREGENGGERRNAAAAGDGVKKWRVGRERDVRVIILYI
jgi:hypothetical protein